MWGGEKGIIWLTLSGHSSSLRGVMAGEIQVENMRMTRAGLLEVLCWVTF